MSGDRPTNSGVGFLGLLTIVFITLKLTGFIGWSWWWVLAPMWIPAAIALAVFVIWFMAFALKNARRGL